MCVCTEPEGEVAELACPARWRKIPRKSLVFFYFYISFVSENVLEMSDVLFTVLQPRAVAAWQSVPIPIPSAALAPTVSHWQPLSAGVGMPPTQSTQISELLGYVGFF